MINKRNIVCTIVTLAICNTSIPNAWAAHLCTNPSACPDGFIETFVTKAECSNNPIRVCTSSGGGGTAVLPSSACRNHLDCGDIDYDCGTYNDGTKFVSIPGKCRYVFSGACKTVSIDIGDGVLNNTAMCSTGTYIRFACADGYYGSCTGTASTAESCTCTKCPQTSGGIGSVSSLLIDGSTGQPKILEYLEDDDNQMVKSAASVKTQCYISPTTDAGLTINYYDASGTFELTDDCHYEN